MSPEYAKSYVKVINDQPLTPTYRVSEDASALLLINTPTIISRSLLALRKGRYGF
jgi:hypothetical protein